MMDLQSAIRDVSLPISDPFRLADYATAQYLPSALNYVFSQPPADSVRGLVVTDTTIAYTVLPDTVSSPAVRVLITGAGFPAGVTRLSQLGSATDYRITSLKVVVDQLPGTQFEQPVSTVTLATDIYVVNERVQTLALTGFSVAAAGVELRLSGTVSLDVTAQSSHRPALDRLRLNDAALVISYDTDPSGTDNSTTSTCEDLSARAEMYLQGDFVVDLRNQISTISSASIRTMGVQLLERQADGNQLRYLSADNVNITLAELRAWVAEQSNDVAVEQVASRLPDIGAEATLRWGRISLPDGAEATARDFIDELTPDAQQLYQTYADRLNDLIASSTAQGGFFEGGVSVDQVREALQQWMDDARSSKITVEPPSTDPSVYRDLVQTAYIAYYGRPADPAGLNFWAGTLMANKGDASAMIDAFGRSAESNALYAGMDDAAKVSAIYRNLFNRNPDSAGLAFYAAELAAGRMTGASIALNVANGAVGMDAQNLAIKQQVAFAFTNALQQDTAAYVAYNGTFATTEARWLITNATTLDAMNNVPWTIASIKAGEQRFTLTSQTVASSPTVLTAEAPYWPLVASAEQVVLDPMPPHGIDERSVSGGTLADAGLSVAGSSIAGFSGVITPGSSAWGLSLGEY
jgi:hypothetical protein